MPLLDLALRYYLRQQRLARAAQAAARQLWRDVRFADLDRSWLQVADRMTVVVSAAQFLAAQEAPAYVAEAMDEQGADATAEAVLAPRSLVGVASDGRPLESLLYAPVVEVKQAVRQAPPARPTRDVAAAAMASGEAALVRVVGTQVQDAGRAATGVVIAATPAATKWVRMLNPPSCGRCAILAGRIYRFSEGFERHENCDCVHIPISENVKNDLTTNPVKYFDSLSREEQNLRFGKARTQRILDGEDLYKVVNSGRRSTRTAGGKPTVEPKRAAPAKAAPSRSRTARSARARRTPEQIAESAASRAEAIEQLRRAGFLT